MSYFIYARAHAVRTACVLRAYCVRTRRRRTKPVSVVGNLERPRSTQLAPIAGTRADPESDRCCEKFARVEVQQCLKKGRTYKPSCYYLSDLLSMLCASLASQTLSAQRRKGTACETSFARSNIMNGLLVLFTDNVRPQHVPNPEEMGGGGQITLRRTKLV